MYERICLVCGRQFQATHGAQRLCGETCRRERYRFQLAQCRANLTSEPARKQCVICQAEFLAGKTESRCRQSKTCSPECRRALQAQNSAEWKRKAKSGRTRNCVECGASFLIKDRPRRRTCSAKCYHHRKRDQTGRCYQRRKASGQIAAEIARYQASGKLKLYKRQNRRRRAQERVRMELLMFATIVMNPTYNMKGKPNGNGNV